MLKRKSKYNVSYTGAEHLPLPAQEPYYGAQAATRMIGESSKKTLPLVYVQPQQMTLALLARRSSLAKRKSFVLKASPAPASAQPTQSMSAKHLYSLRSSNALGVLDESSRRNSLTASNEARMRDLKLQYKPPKSPEPSVKMVKKYIPTPNGIQIVEFPEPHYKQELARCNSMRSGLSGRTALFRVTRLPSLNSASTKNLPRSVSQRKGPNLYLSSFTNQPIVAEEPDMSESNKDLLPESAFLRLEIERERKVAKALEKRRSEYEQLERLRAENFEKLNQLQQLRSQDHVSMDKRDPAMPQRASMDKRDSAMSQHVPTLTTDPELVMPGYVNEDSPSHFANFSAPADQADEDKEEMPITQLSSAVNDFDLKDAENGQISPQICDSFIGSAYTLDDSSSQSNLIVTSALEVLETCSPNVNSPDARDKDFGIEEVALEQFDSPKLNKKNRASFATMSPPLASASGEKDHLPKFCPIPQVMGESRSTTIAASSIRSTSSLDSKSRPIKSAMRNSKTRYLSGKSASVSPAEQAYISLATAENTRINSKLFTLQLNPDGETGVKSPSPSATSTPQKRLSHTFRKQPSSTMHVEGGTANRTTRPRRHSDIRKSAQAEQSSNVTRKLSARSLRTEPKPIATHSVLSPNYQSPSKQKAAALYAKANMRPLFQFEPSVKRNSSYSRDPDGPEHGRSEPARKPHMISLREQHPKPSFATDSPGISNTRSTMPIFTSSQPSSAKLRLPDSDDDHVYVKSVSKSSRFRDSDEEDRPFMPHSSGLTLRQSLIKPLRDGKGSKGKKKAKPPKNKLIKKIFGRS